MKSPKQVVPVRLTVEQRKRIKAIVDRSNLLDESKFIRLAVDFLLQHDVGEVMAAMMNDRIETALSRLTYAINNPR